MLRFLPLLMAVCALLGLGSGTFAQAERLQVIASHSILADVVSQVAGEQADVASLIPRGTNPHSFEPAPSDLTRVADADLLLLNGIGYEAEWLDAIRGAGEAVPTVSASACVPIEAYGGGSGHMEHDDEHDDEHGHDDHDNDADHDDEHDEHDDDEHGHDEHDDEHGHDDHDDEHGHDDDADHDDEHEHDDHDAEHDDDEHGHDDHDAEHDDDEHGHDDHDEHDDEHGHDDHDDDADEHDDDHAEHDCDSHDAELAALLGASPLSTAATLGREHDIDCSQGHDHHGHGHGHGHDEGSCDPHIWMNPQHVLRWIYQIRDALSAVDHANAASYAANAASYADAVASLHKDFIAPAVDQLPAARRLLITSHEFLGYFTSAYGFDLVMTVVPESEVAEPSARDIAELVDLIREREAPALFGDTFATDSTMQAIAQEADVALLGLYSDALSPSDGPAGNYLDYMRYNIETILTGLGG